MKRLPALLTVAVIILAVASWYLYHFLTSKEELTPWDLVPDNVVLVYEYSGCGDCTASLSASPVGTLIGAASASLEPRDSLNKVAKFLYQVHDGGLVSMQITRTDDYDLVFYMPLDRTLTQASINMAEETWHQDKSLKFSQREFNGITINEVSSKKAIFSWTVIEHVWVGSFTPFLVEDAIRAYGDKNRRFKTAIQDLNGLARVKNDAGNLYVNVPKLIEAVSVFSSGGNLGLMSLGQHLLMDVKKGDNGLVLDGFTTTTNDKKSLLNLFSEQDPVAFDLKDLISNRTVFLTNYAFSDAKKFFDRVNAGYPAREDSTSRALRTYGVDVTSLHPFIHDNLAEALVESKGQAFSKIGLVETSDTTAWLSLFGKVASSSETADTLFYEHYYSYSIREVELRRFPDHLFFPFFQGYNQTYYTFRRHTLIFSDDLEELKHFLDDIENDETWGRSVAMNHFLESTLLESNLSYYFNAPRLWNLLLGRLSSPWQNFVRQHQDLLDQLGAGAIQFSNLNEQFYTNFFWQFESAPNPTASSRLVANFDTPLKGKIFVVRNHIDKSLELLVQDSLNNLYLLSGTGDVQWKRPLNGEIVGDVDQVDFFKNGKLQYFFATANTLYIIDRLGNPVPPFPVTVPAKENIDFAKVVDYDKSRNYRFLVTEEEGRLWLYDKTGEPLEGWNPRNVNGTLFAAARHQRIGARDYMLAIRRDGSAWLMNRRGETLKNFPLDLNARPNGNFAFEAGKNGTASRVVLVSRDGFKIIFNLDGNVLSREPLPKESIDARFSLAASADLESYVVVRQEPKQLVIYDEEGQPILTNKILGLNPIDVGYFDLGAGRTYISVTDLDQELTYLYDGQGNLLRSVPLESSSVAIFPKSITEAQLVTLYHKTLTFQPLSR